MKKLKGHTSFVRSATFSFDGAYIYSGSDDTTIRVWNVASGKCIKELKGHTNRISSICLNSSGNTLISGSDDTCLIVWDLRAPSSTLKIGGEFQHNGGVSNIVYSKNDRKIISESSAMLGDRTRHVWNVESGHCVCIAKLDEPLPDEYQSLFAAGTVTTFTNCVDLSAVNTCRESLTVGLDAGKNAIIICDENFAVARDTADSCTLHLLALKSNNNTDRMVFGSL